MYTTITIVLTTVITILITNVITNVIIAAITTAHGKINTLTCRPFKLTMGNMFSSDTVVNSSTAKSLLLYLVTSWHKGDDDGYDSDDCGNDDDRSDVVHENWREH